MDGRKEEWREGQHTWWMTRNGQTVIPRICVSFPKSAPLVSHHARRERDPDRTILARRPDSANRSTDSEARQMMMIMMMMTREKSRGKRNEKQTLILSIILSHSISEVTEGRGEQEIDKQTSIRTLRGAMRDCHNLTITDSISINITTHIYENEEEEQENGDKE